jgi:hypothetical protein
VTWLPHPAEVGGPLGNEEANGLDASWNANLDGDSPTHQKRGSSSTWRNARRIRCAAQAPGAIANPSSRMSSTAPTPPNQLNTLDSSNHVAAVVRAATMKATIVTIEFMYTNRKANDVPCVW